MNPNRETNPNHELKPNRETNPNHEANPNREEKPIEEKTIEDPPLIATLTMYAEPNHVGFGP